MTNVQPGILTDIPRLARYMMFTLVHGADTRQAIAILSKINIDNTVVGIGHSLLLAARVTLKRVRDFPSLVGPGVEIPSTPYALFCWLKGDDRGELIHRSRAIEKSLANYFAVVKSIDAFQYADSRDMTGYEDGTENPKGNDALDAAILQGQGDGMDGSSFVAIQQWVHDLDAFESMSEKQQDNIFGRHKRSNEEFDVAPPTAHVKRTAQESFEPNAFIVRRSMPWSDGQSVGLVFVAFGHSFDAFEAILVRMAGLDDGVVDGLFNISRPVSGSYFWCPPVKLGQLDLTIVNL